MICGGALPWPVRIDAIANELKQLDADVLFLQEVYDVHALSALHKRLSSSYAHFYGNVPATLFGLSHESLLPSSGLAMISKFPLENLRFEPYTIMTNEKESGFDRLNRFGFDRNYGIFHCDVINGKETLAHIATTHENPFYADVRGKQTLQIVESFEKEATMRPEVPMILCGDLNIERGDMSEGGEKLLKEHFVDHYSGEGPTWFAFGNYWARKWHKDPTGFLDNPQPWTVDRSLLWTPWASKNPYAMTVERV
jgi:endonuclease/exonuclease/phosphatase family metal-dependent hydrolase